jgi:hypothetical protein
VTDDDTARPEDGEVLIRHRSRARTYALGVLLILAIALLAVRAWPTHHAPRFCEGVGLGGPPADSPRAALDAWIMADGSQPPSSAWVQSGDDFMNTRYEGGRASGMHSVMVERGSAHSLPQALPPDKWTVQGGCV